MAAILYIGYPHHPWNAITTSASAEDASYPHANTITGSRSTVYKRGSAGTSANITYDLGTGNTGQSEYLIAARADLISTLTSDADIALRASTDNFSASDVSILSITNFTVANLVGTKTEDILLTGSLSTAYRYWRVAFTSTTSVNYSVSKLYFGQWFTFTDVGPIHPYSAGQAVNQRNFTTDAGNTFMSRGGRDQKIRIFTWDVNDATAQSFFTTIGKFWDVHTFFLYITDAACYHLLDGASLMHVRFVAPPIRTSGLRNRNVISCQFIEEVS